MLKVSVIVPIYNAEKYLVQCLDSIYSQTLKDIEIILINDGSTDRSADICKKYLTDSRTVYYYKENEGLAAARQDGMERASGEYIGFVDSDDWIEPDMYEKMYQAAVSNHSDVVFCNCIENEDGHRFTPEMRSGAFDREQIKKDILPGTLAYIDKKGGKRAIRWSNCLRLYRREFLKENGICFDRRFRRSQDLQLTYRSALYAQNYYYLGDDYLYHNRVVNDSLSRGYTKNMWSLYVLLINRLYEDTENFKEMDLMPQMHLRAFFFASDCIDNELKELCPNDRKTKLKLINEIINDPICGRFYGYIPVEKLDPLLQKYHELIHKKDAEGILSFAEKYRRKRKWINNYWKPFKRSVCSTKIYRMLRG